MDQIIKLGQELLSKEEILLNELQLMREDALNVALRLQGEIPVQRQKVEEVTKNLEELYRKYGYPNSQSGCASVSPAMPSMKKPTKGYSKDEDLD